MITNKEKRYLSESLGLLVSDFDLPAEERQKLPLYIRKLKLSGLVLEEKKVVAVKIDSLQNYTPKTLDTYREIIESAFNIPALFCLNELQPFERKRLIERRISFYLTGKQLYVPSLMMDLNEFRSRPPKTVEKFSPATQFMLLYHLQKCSLDGSTLSQVRTMIADAYSLMTIGRSVEELQTAQLCGVESRRSKTIRFRMERKELWEASLPYLEIPVAETLYCPELPASVKKINSGNSALAHYTNLRDSGPQTIALPRKEIGKLKRTINLYGSEFGGNLRIESWKYDPSVLSTNNRWVDPLSLFLCYRNDPDERVQLALAKLIEEVW